MKSFWLALWAALLTGSPATMCMCSVADQGAAYLAGTSSDLSGLEGGGHSGHFLPDFLIPLLFLKDHGYGPLGTNKGAYAAAFTEVIVDLDLSGIFVPGDT